MESAELPEWQNIPFETILDRQTFVTKYPDCFECSLLEGAEKDFGKYKLVKQHEIPVYLCDAHYASLSISKYLGFTPVSP